MNKLKLLIVFAFYGFNSYASEVSGKTFTVISSVYAQRTGKLVITCLQKIPSKREEPVTFDQISDRWTCMIVAKRNGMMETLHEDSGMKQMNPTPDIGRDLRGYTVLTFSPFVEKTKKSA